MIAGSQLQIDSSAILVFDTRKMSGPVTKFCHGSESVLSLSWGPSANMIVGSTTNKKLLVWEGANYEAIWEQKCDAEVSDVHWNKVITGCFATASENKISLYNLLDGETVQAA